MHSLMKSLHLIPELGKFVRQSDIKMITFVVSILLLVAAYFVYGKIVEKYLDVDPSRQTPAYAKE